MQQQLSIIRISGVVQGVGFRPCIYRIAKKLGLPGWVRNLGDAGVEVQVEGSKKDILEFITVLKKERPANSRIDDIRIEWKNSPGNFNDFKIIESGGRGIEGITPADIAVCPHCVDDILDKDNRRHLYPFTTCTDCGPRFTTIRGIPYDRQNTAFAEFPPCKECGGEYSSPEDRRFHAQTIACGKCGPAYFLVDNTGKEISNPIKNSIKLLNKGKVLIIKGIGGMHLACSTTDDAAIEELRRRLNRPQRPFAIMATLEMVEESTRISAKEKELLLSKERPILVLRKTREFPLSKNLAPGLDTIGVMLPYTGLHEILFQGLEEPLVMTSANLPGEPMFMENGEAQQSKIADYCLLHNLGIENRCDDSVIKIVNNIGTFIRRSRGLVPLPIPVKKESKDTILSLGAEENVTACLLKGNRAFLTQFIGDTDSPNTVEFLENSARHLLSITTSKPDRIACDLHPRFHTTRLAESLAKEFNVPLVRVQHHYAHLASLMAESGAESMVGICCDGAGYGEDSNTWGGEIIAYDGEFTRTGHLKEQRMPGGDLAAYYPGRMVLGILSDIYSPEELKNIAIKNNLEFKHGEKEIDVVLQQLEKGVNVPVTTSTGRVLDSVSAVLGLCHYRSYDGEPAMKLDSAGNEGKQLDFPISIKDSVLDTTEILVHALSLKEDGKRVEDIAFSAEAAIAEGLAKIAAKEAKKRGIDFIGISGGVAYNDVIVRKASEIVKNSGLKFVQHQEIPPGDGGISIGQVYFSAFYC